MTADMVSIVSPCYNGEKYIGVFLDSVLNQTYDNIELIVVDDGSRDNSAVIIHQYQKRFSDRGYELKYFFQVNMGQAAAINEGLKHVQGQYFMWADSDDIMMPQSVSEKVKYLKEHKEIDFVLSQEGVVQFGKEEEIIRITRRDHSNIRHDNLFADMIRGRNVVFGPGTVMVRMEKLKIVIPELRIFPSREGQNWQLMLPITYCLRGGYIDEVHLKCVIYPDSHSRRERSTREYLDRNDGIRVLICKTLESIPEIRPHDLEYWTRFIIDKYGRANLYLSYDLKDKIKIGYYKKLLKDNKCFSCKSTLAWYWLRKIKASFGGKI